MTQREAFEAWARVSHVNRNVFTDDQDLTIALPMSWSAWQAAQAQAASTKDFSNLTNQAHGYSDVVSLGGMDPRNYAAANGVRQAAVKPVAYLTETEQGPMVWTPDMYGEACTYCDDGEFPVPLYTSPPDSPKAMRLALEALKFIKQWGECALAVEKRDAAIAALEKEVKHD